MRTRGFTLTTYLPPIQRNGKNEMERIETKQSESKQFVPKRSETERLRNLTRRAAFAVLVGAPLGTWSALVSLPRTDSATLAWAAAGAAGTYSSALIVLLETAVPRVGSLAARTILPEFYAAVVAFMPVAAMAQAS